ncbi:MAG: hypothetical protein ACI86C_000952, partial [Candidatus Latescibacterota bacterium]
MSKSRFHNWLYLILLFSFSANASVLLDLIPTKTHLNKINTISVVLPIADAGPDRAICLFETTQLGVASDPNYAYMWSSMPNDGSISDPSISNPTVSPLVSTLYTLTVTEIANGETAIDTVTVNVNPLPVVDPGIDANICLGNSIQLGTSAQGGFSYLWTSLPPGFNSALADPVVSPIVTTQYFLTVTNNTTLCENSDDVTVTVDNLPVIDAGPNATLCEEQGAFSLSTASGPVSGVQYTWQSFGDGSFNDTSLLNPVYTFGALDISIGSATLRLSAQSDAGGCSLEIVQDDIILTIVPSLGASAGIGGTICGNDSFQVNATFTNYSSISWTSSGSPGTLSGVDIEDPVYTPSAQDITSGSVVLTVTVLPENPCTTPYTGQITVNINAAPEITLTGALLICEGDTAQPLASVTNWQEITWSSSGDGFFIPAQGLNTLDPTYVPGPLDIQTGSALLTIQATGNGSCAPESNQTLLTIQGDVEVDAGPDGNMCDGPYLLDAATASNYDTITWTTSGDGTFSNSSIINPTY